MIQTFTHICPGECGELSQQNAASYLASSFAGPGDEDDDFNIEEEEDGDDLDFLDDGELDDFDTYDDEDDDDDFY
jgi:hypothetical protein